MLNEEELSPELAAKLEDLKRNSVSGVYEITEENMATLRELYDEHPLVFCPSKDTTFEQFCGFMIVAGTNFMQREFVKFSMKKMFEDLIK